MKLFVHLVGIVSVVSGMAAADSKTASSVVTIPIQEYLELRKVSELAKVTSVEEVRLEGTFGKELTLSFRGRCAAGLEPKEVLKHNEDIGMSDCKGDALLDVQGDTVRLVPLQRQFKLTCRIQSKNWNEFSLQILNAFSFSGRVTGAEVIAESDDSHGLNVLLTPKQLVSHREERAVTGTAKYRISIQPEQTTFQYAFRLSNPNRGTRSYEIKWLNGETIQKVRGIASYNESEESLKLTLSPGENRVVVNGRYSGDKFQPLMPSQQQYLLVESHPTLQLTVNGKGRRISLNDDDLRPQFTNARLYVFSKESSFSWTTRKLDVLEAMGYSVKSANYRYYVPESGKPIVEASFDVENQGTPEIPLKIPGTPTYLEVNREPQVLYKNTDGRLLVQVPSGSSTVFLQYRTDKATSRVLASHNIELVKPEAVLSNVSLSLLTPFKWRLLYGMGLAGSASDFPETLVIWSFLLAGLLYFLSGLWQFGKRARWFIALSGLVLPFLVLDSVLFFVMAAVIMTLVRYRLAIWSFLKKRSIWMNLLIACAIGVPLLIVLTWSSTLFLGSSRMALNKSLSQTQNYAAQEPRMAEAAAPSPVKKAGGEGADGEEDSLDDQSEATGQGSQETFQGLPAKIVIPWNVEETTFSQSSVDVGGKIWFVGFLVSRGLMGGLYFVLFFSVVAVFLTRWRAIWGWTLYRQPDSRNR